MAPPQQPSIPPDVQGRSLSRFLRMLAAKNENCRACQRVHPPGDFISTTYSGCIELKAAGSKSSTTGKARDARKSDASQSPFSEVEAWRSAGPGWQPIYGSFHGTGFSFEWHDFTPKSDFDWAATFHPGSLELCLNFSGTGVVFTSGGECRFDPPSAGFYRTAGQKSRATRLGGQHHQFLTIEYSRPFLNQSLPGLSASLHPIARDLMEDRPAGEPCVAVTRLAQPARLMVESLRHPPVSASVHPIWYQCKAIELAVTFLVQPPEGEEFFCTRQQRLAQERVELVAFLLKQNLVEPPPLEELGRKIGCSHFYLSRIFSAQTGQTISQYLRDLRLEKAAELLRQGEHNVTEAAMEVGYSSLSHFSQAFHEKFGCCPGLYPVRTSSQK
ncbi:MAG: helix-turn-helix transcriptional regulator [Verrucomicrobia bacterium]|nr:helix-turn-helix transcriptional regulator [Verrucomicrobiota bacterium]